jgi:hypothetical protein
MFLGMYSTLKRVQSKSSLLDHVTMIFTKNVNQDTYEQYVKKLLGKEEIGRVLKKTLTFKSCLHVEVIN